MAQFSFYLIQNLLNDSLDPLFFENCFCIENRQKKKRQRRGSEGLLKEPILSLVAVGLNWDVNWSLQRFCSTPKSNDQTQDCV